jgi:hypothetical protein
MRISIYVLALAPIFFVGCAEEPTTLTTTTTREVTTTGPAAREVVVTQGSASRPGRIANGDPRPGICLDARLLALDRNRLRVGIRRLGYATATDCCAGSGSLGAQIGRLGVDRGPLAAKIELVGGA